MFLLEQFKQYLFSQKKPASKLTVKNYIADVNQFVKWSESFLEVAFDPKVITPQIIEIYKSSKLKAHPPAGGLPPTSALSSRTMERHISSLKKFFYFLKLESYISSNPFEQLDAKRYTLNADPYYLKEFKNHLYVYNSSSLTIKNYVNDVKNFLKWFEVTCDKKEIDILYVEEYKQRLLKSGYCALTVNRKLSSLRKYIKWASQEGLFTKKSAFADFGSSTKVGSNLDSHLTNNILQKIGNVKNVEVAGFAPAEPWVRIQVPYSSTPTLPSTLTEKVSARQYSSIPPIRLLQKIFRGFDFILDLTIIKPLADIFLTINYLWWKLRGRKVFNKFPASSAGRQISNIKKEVYAPLAISTAGFPFYKKFIYYLRHSRPQWYKTYHSYQFTHYFHIIILVAATAFLGALTYESIFPNTKKAVLSEISENPVKPKILSFQGKLADSFGNPIVGEKNVKFSLYNDPVSAGSSMLWENTIKVKTDIDGNFNASPSISEKILTDNSSLWLGISIENEDEIIPRQEIPTLSYAGNTQYLEGLSPITNSNAGVKNVILALDSNGNLNIGQNATPVFEATSGQFTLSGQVLFLTTNKGSSQDVVLSPDGFGKIDLQKPLYNSMGNGIEIFDNLIVASSNSAKPIFVASASGQTHFLVSGDGNVGIGTASPSAKLEVLGDIKTSKDLIVDGKTTLNSIAYSWPTTAAVKNSILSNKGDGTLSWTSLDTLSNSSDIFKLHVEDTKTATSTAFIFNKSDNEDADVLALKIGKETATTNNKFISFLNSKGEVTGSISGNGSGGVSYTSTGSDFAEYFRKSQITNPHEFEPGTLVCLAEDGGALACDNEHTNIVGIVSEKAGFVGGSNYANNPDYVLVGLNGQLPLKVSLENGEIKAGDPVTYSSIPGIGAKAVEGGMIVGKAIQTLSAISSINSILVFLNVSYYNPQIYVNADGDFKFSQIAANNELGNQANDLPNKDDNVQLLASETNLYNPTIKEKTFKERFQVLKNAISNKLIAFEITTKKLTVDSMELTSDSFLVAGTNLNDYIAQILNSELLTLNSKLIVSPIAKIDQIHTNIISPLSADSDIIVKLASESAIQNSKFKVQSSEGKDVATIDSSGSARFAGDIESRQASFSGQLSANSASISGDLLASNLQTKEASIEGTLRADRIIATNIEGFENLASQGQALQEKIASLSSRLSSNSQFSTFNSQLSTLNVDFATFNQSLIALGPSSFTDIAISNQLSIGSNLGSMLVLADNAINVLGNTLEFQSLRQGGISFVGGGVFIDPEGNLKVNGNAEFAKNVAIKGVLSANIISPLPESDFMIRLNSSSIHDSKFMIQNSSESAVLTVNQNGDVASSGSANFTDILTKGLSIVRSAQADTSLTETIASSSAGTATIIQGETERTIITPYVKEDSLIYVTPASDTDGVVPYVARQTIQDPENDSKGSFTIKIPQRLYKDININWWTVN